jgi:hypothetical protein
MSESSTDQQTEENVAPETEQVEGAAPEWLSNVESQGDTEQSAAESPPADTEDGQEKPGETLLDAVTKAARGEVEQEQSPGSEQDDGEGQDPAASADTKDGEEDLGEVTDEELQSYKPKTRKRIEGLLNERKELAAERDQYKQSHEQLESVRNYFAQTGLSSDDINNTVEIARLIKADPAKALEQIKPIYERLQMHVGERLPDDLQTQVNQGYLSQAHAKELASRRHETERLRQHEQQRTEQERQRSVEQQRQQFGEQVGRAVSEWEQSWSKSDPDHSRKVPFVRDRIKAKLSGLGRGLQSADEAVKLADEAKAEIDREMRSFAPKRPEERPVTGGTTQPSARPAPKSTYEAIARAVGQ